MKILYCALYSSLQICCTEILYSTIQMFIRLQIKLVLCKFSKLCTVCTVPCTVAYKCAVHKYCTAQYKCSLVLKWTCLHSHSSHVTILWTLTSNSIKNEKMMKWNRLFCFMPCAQPSFRLSRWKKWVVMCNAMLSTQFVECISKTFAISAIQLHKSHLFPRKIHIFNRRRKSE